MNIFKEFTTVMPGYYVNPAATAKNTIKESNDMKKVINDYFKMHRAINKEAQFNKKVALNIEIQNFKQLNGLFLNEAGGLVSIILAGLPGETAGKITPIYKKDRAGNVYRAGYKYDNYCK
jgi:hypothetical protein